MSKLWRQFSTDPCGTNSGVFAAQAAGAEPEEQIQRLPSTQRYQWHEKAHSSPPARRLLQN